MSDTVFIEYAILLMQTIIIPWIIQIDRRLSRLEGYIKRNGGDCRTDRKE